MTPKTPSRVYVPNTRSVVSEDGGKTFRELVQGGGVHVDHRALLIDPDDSKRVLLGTDGGLYASYDRGENWEFMPNLPVMQFYTVSVDEREPFYYVYGGTQDNNSFGGPSGTRNIDGIVNDDWFMTVPGDGFHVQIDPRATSHRVYRVPVRKASSLRHPNRRASIDPAAAPGGREVSMELELTDSHLAS